MPNPLPSVCQSHAKTSTQRQPCKATLKGFLSAVGYEMQPLGVNIVALACARDLCLSFFMTDRQKVRESSETLCHAFSLGS